MYVYMCLLVSWFYLPQRPKSNDTPVAMTLPSTQISHSTKRNQGSLEKQLLK